MSKDTNQQPIQEQDFNRLYAYFKHVDRGLYENEHHFHEWEKIEIENRHRWRERDAQRMEGKSKDEQLELMRAERDKWRLAAMNSEQILSRRTADLNRFSAVGELMILAHAGLMEGTSNVYGLVDSDQYVNSTALLMRDALVESFCHDEDRYRDARHLKALLEMESYCKPFRTKYNSLAGGMHNYLKWWEHRGPDGDKQLIEAETARINAAMNGRHERDLQQVKNEEAKQRAEGK